MLINYTGKVQLLYVTIVQYVYNLRTLYYFNLSYLKEIQHVELTKRENKQV